VHRVYGGKFEHTYFLFSEEYVHILILAHIANVDTSKMQTNLMR